MFGKIGKIGAILLLVVMAMGLVGCSASDDGDSVVFGGSRVIHSGERVDGDLVVLGGDVEVQEGAEVAGDVVVMGGSVLLDGRIGNDVAVMGGSVQTGEHSDIGGEIVTLGGDVMRADLGNGVDNITPPEEPVAPIEPVEPVEPVAPVAPIEPVEPVTPRFRDNPPGFFDRAISGVFGIFGTMMQAVAFGALGLVLTMFMPDHVRRIGTAAEAAPAASMGVGFLATLAVGFLMGIAILASFLLIGIPFAILIPLVTSAAWLIGLIGIGFFFGNRLLKGADIRSPRAPAAAAIGTGTLILVGSLIGWIPFIGDFFGTLLVAVMGFWALGATVLTRGGTQIYPPLLTRTAGAPIGSAYNAPRAAPERPAPPRSGSGSGNLFADLANDLGLDEDDLKDDKTK
jgi:hypothetical protein